MSLPTNYQSFFISLLMALILAGPAWSNNASPSYKQGMPEEVRSLVETGFNRDQYQEMAEPWEKYAQKNPSSAFANIMIYKALFYGGEQDSKKLQGFISKALELDPDCPEALVAAMGTALRHGEPMGTQAACYRYGLKAVEAAPTWAEPHSLLYVLATRLGRHDEAKQHLKNLLDKGFFTPALIDYGYNMLVSAAPGGVIITNGDNDSFPCMALQAGRNIRTDVTVANLSLMTLTSIAKHYLTQPTPGFDPIMELVQFDELEQTFLEDRQAYGFMLGNILLEQMCTQASQGTLHRPLYLAVTLVPNATSRCASALSLEGLLQRVVPGDPDQQGQPVTNISKTMNLFNREYRLDSATDLTTNWKHYGAHLHLIKNYSNILFRLGYDAAAIDDTKTMNFGFDESMKISTFHHDEALSEMVLDYWEKLAPKSKPLKQWQKDLR